VFAKRRHYAEWISDAELVAYSLLDAACWHQLQSSKSLRDLQRRSTLKSTLIVQRECRWAETVVPLKKATGPCLCIRAWPWLPAWQRHSSLRPNAGYETAAWFLMVTIPTGLATEKSDQRHNSKCRSQH
jgi:hypothetical protein